MDPKGRVSIPTRFREQVPPSEDGLQLVVTRGISDDCLWAYTLDEWDRVEEEIRAKKSSPAKDAFVRLFIGSAHDCTIDKLGRILVPPMLRKKAGLNKQVVMVGANNKFEMWDQERYEEFVDSLEKLSLAQNFVATEEIRV